MASTAESSDDASSTQSARSSRRLSRRKSKKGEVWLQSLFNFEERQTHVLKSRKRSSCNLFPPSSEVAVRRLNKKKLVLPPDDSSSLLLYVRFCFKFWTAPWVFVDRPFAAFQSAPAPVAELPRLVFADDLSDASLVSAQLTRRDLQLKLDASEPSFELPLPVSQFSLVYNPTWDWGRGMAYSLADRNFTRLGDPNTIKVFQQPQAIQFLVEPGAFELEVGNVEPLFCSLALYHVNLGTKISETFHYAIDTSGHLDLVRTGLGPDLQGDMLDEERCVFSVASPSKFIHLVLTVYRVLQGDEEKSAEPYLDEGEKSALSTTLRSPFQNAARKLGKIKDQTQTFCARLGSYRQTFAFASMAVFDDDGRFTLSDSSFASIYLLPPGDDFSICESILHPNPRRLKSVAAKCAVSVRRLGAKDMEESRMDAALTPYKINYDDANSKVASKKGDHRAYLRDMFDLSPVSKALPYMSFISTLFVYPLAASLQVDRKKSVALRIEFRSSDDDKVTVPLKRIFSTTGAIRRILTDSANTTVVYGAKNPTWTFEEVRIHLPPHITQKHHLMCFFSEIDVEAVRKETKGTESEKLIGVSIIKLLDGKSGALVDANGTGTRVSLPIISCDEPLPRGYLALAEQDKLPCLENGKELFQLSIRGFSSVFSSNQAIASLMKIVSSGSSSNGPDTMEWADEDISALTTTLVELRSVNMDLIVPHFPTLTYSLLLLMGHSTECAQQTFQTLVTMLYRIHVLDKRPKEKRTGMVHQFIEYVFEQNNIEGGYHSIVTQWITLAILVKKGVVEDESITQQVLCSVSWMLFDMVYKLLVLTPRDETLPRAQQFSPDFPRLLRKLLLELRVLLFQIVDGSGGGLRSSIEEVGGVGLNVNIAMFLSDLVSVYDRGVVVDLVMQHVDEFWAEIALRREAGQAGVAASLNLLLLDFFKVFCDTEHFVQLNIPKPLSIGAGSTDELREEIEEKHPLPGKLAAVLVQELINSNATLETRCLALSVMTNLVMKIDRDARFQDIHDRHRIAIMFFPLVLRIVDVWKLTDVWRQGTDAFRLYERQELGASIVWILANLDRAWLQRWWACMGADWIFSNFVPVLEDLLRVFCMEKKAEMLASPYGTHSGNVEALADLSKHGAGSLLKLRTRYSGKNVLSEILESGSETGKENWLRFKLVSHHVATLVLGLADNLMSDFPADVWSKVASSALSTASVPASPASLQLASLIHVIMESVLSVEAVRNMFLLLYRFVVGQRVALFCTSLKTEANRIISAVLLLCSSPLPEIRSEASTFFYFLLVQNMKLMGSFENVKNSAVLACSRLAEEHQAFGGPALQTSLDCIAAYALDDLYSPKDDFDDEKASLSRVIFVKQVQETCRALAAIVHDTKKIVSSKGSSDVEMVAEQYFRMAEGYRYSPELRLEWLEKLAQFHAKNEDYPEAAIAMTHVLALLADYLNSCTDTKISTSLFKTINPAIAEFYSEEASAGGSSSFCLRHTKFVAKAVIKFLGQATLYEMANEVHRLLLALYHAEGSYRDLTNAHTELEGFYTKLTKGDTDRLLGRYYRVGFYGPLFGPELDGIEFIYKEPLLTHLFALKDRLTGHFGALFGGDDKIEVLEHGGLVDTSTLDPKKGYLQITALRPVWPDEEEPMRRTFIQKNTRLSMFAYETPFSKGGKVGQTTTAEQWMRRTVLTSEYFFPYVLKRIPVRSRHEVVLSPIEIAIELMQNRIEKLQQEVARNPPDSKTLQQVLQGSVLTTVNRGIIEYLEIFLVNASEFPRHHTEALEEKFKGFFAVAKEALQVNKSLVDSSDSAQREFHKEMMNGFSELCKLAEPLLDSSQADGGGEDGGNESSGGPSPRVGSCKNSPRVGSNKVSPRSYLPPVVQTSSPINSPKTRRRNKAQTGRASSPRGSHVDGQPPEDVSSSPQESLFKTAHRLSVRRASLNLGKTKKSAGSPLASPRGSASNSPATSPREYKL